MGCRRPVAMAVEQRADGATVEHAGKRIVVGWRRPVGDGFPGDGARGIVADTVGAVGRVERANVQADGIGRSAAKADGARLVPLLQARSAIHAPESTVAL